MKLLQLTPSNEALRAACFLTILNPQVDCCELCRPEYPHQCLPSHARMQLVHATWHAPMHPRLHRATVYHRRHVWGRSESPFRTSARSCSLPACSDTSRSHPDTLSERTRRRLQTTGTRVWATTRCQIAKELVEWVMSWMIGQSRFAIAMHLW